MTARRALHRVACVILGTYLARALTAFAQAQLGLLPPTVALYSTHSAPALLAVVQVVAHDRAVRHAYR